MKKRALAVRMAISAILLAVFLSSCQLFGFVESFRILKPMQGENTGTNKRPLFMWTALEDAVSYELQADDSASFDSIDYYWTGIPGTTFTPPTDMNISVSPPVGTRYSIRVRGVDASGRAGGWRMGMFRVRYVNVGRFDNDFNGDGYSDVLKGDGVYLGGSSMDGIEDLSLTGVDGGIVSAGDVNRDGYCDVLTGNGIYFGGAVMDGDADLTWTDETTGGYFGSAIASAGDVNADGYSDVIRGDGGYNNYQGKVYIYFGGAPMDGSADVVITGEPICYEFGFSVASAGDVNGDGYLDVIVGAGRQVSVLPSWQNVAYIFFGGSQMDGASFCTTKSVISGFNSRKQRKVSSAGDMNGDGYSDVLVTQDTMSGELTISFGSASMTATSGYYYDAFGPCIRTGLIGIRRIAPAGDVNDDGYDDVIAGIPEYRNPLGDPRYAARALIYLGGASVDNKYDVDIIGELPYDINSWSIAHAGDVNGDGYDDVLIGESVYLGGSPIDNTADIIISN